MSVARHDPIRRPVYRALHSPLTLGVAGVHIDRRFVFLSAVAGMGAVALLKSFVLAGLAIVLILAAGVATRHDPQMLPIVWRAQFLRARYDPLKYQRFTIHVVDDGAP